MIDLIVDVVLDSGILRVFGLATEAAVNIASEISAEKIAESATAASVVEGFKSVAKGVLDRITGRAGMRFFEGMFKNLPEHVIGHIFGKEAHKKLEKLAELVKERKVENWYEFVRTAEKAGISEEELKKGIIELPDKVKRTISKEHTAELLIFTYVEILKARKENAEFREAIGELEKLMKDTIAKLEELDKQLQKLEEKKKKLEAKILQPIVYEFTRYGKTFRAYFKDRFKDVFYDEEDNELRFRVQKRRGEKRYIIAQTFLFLSNLTFINSRHLCCSSMLSRLVEGIIKGIFENFADHARFSMIGLIKIN